MFHSRMLPAAVLLLLVFHSGTAFSRVYHVRWDVAGGGTGLSWGEALCHPQLAVDLAQDGDEVWVAVGVYDYPVFGHDAVLEMKSGVAVYGAFAGSETSREQRDRNTYQSVLEGYFYSFCDGHEQPAARQRRRHVQFSGLFQSCRPQLRVLQQLGVLWGSGVQ